MSTYTIYDKATGLFTGSKITSTNSNLVKENIPDGCDVVIGDYDHLQYKVDLKRKKVVEYQPPSPGPNHTWDDNDRRWVYIKQKADYEAEVRAIRDQMIARTDWVVTRAAEKGGVPNKLWTDYRQALRDIPTQSGFPFDITWPVAPPT